MKIRQYIKRMATLALMVALLAPLQEAWGQEKGNRYKTSVTVVKKYYATIEDDDNAALQKAFDGDREGTWWDAASAGPKTITIELESNQTLASVNYYGGGGGENVAMRPSEVQVYYSSNGYDWNSLQTFSNIDRTVRDRTLTISGNNRKSAKFYRLVLVPGLKGDGSYQTLAMNEITLYNQNNRVINVPSPDEETIGNLAAKTIIHKHPKWFELRSNISEGAKNMDTFNDDIPTFGPPEDENMVTWTGTIQAAHTYIDTIYMHPGSSVDLTLPDKLGDVSVRGYQRWYSFRTDGTYRTNNTRSDQVWDLLTPTVGTSYRFANGYVSKPVDTDANGTYQMKFYFPTSEEFKSWFNTNSSSPGFDGNWFVVACDVSGYNDYTASFDKGNSSKSDFLKTLYEPTLTHRVLYYIASVDDRTGDKWTNGHGRLSQNAYQGGGNTDGKKYLEEYEISFPFTRLSNTVVPTIGPNTTASPEQVALSKDARAYAIPKELLNGVSDTDELTVTLIDGDGIDDEKNSGIQLIEASTYKVGNNSYRNYTNVQSLTISGENRVIQFSYPNTISNRTQTVKSNNSTATILVTKQVGGTTYNIARYKLRFVADTRLLTQSQLKAIENGTIQDETMKYYQFRTPEYLDKNYQLLTALNWDYDPDVAGTYGQDEYYPFPMAWAYSSYSFFDGAPAEDFVKVSYDMPSPEWGYYAIMNGFVESKWTNMVHPEASKLSNSTYHLYVDASDRPGVIANLPFRQALCKGSELFVSAWVKSAGYSEGTPDAGMLFTIMGVEADGTKVPLYSHSSSQIRRTDYLKGGLPGTGSTTNEWLQVYFSFINKSDVTYQTYELQVSNNSESTEGGDMYLDDVRVYMATPSATVSQLEATCASERTRMNIKMDWERLLSRTGAVEGTGGERAIDFCFIDQLLYNQYIKNNASNPSNPTEEEIAKAIEASVQDIGDGKTFNDQFVTLNYKLNYDSNKDYNDPSLPQKGDDNPLWGPLAINNKVDDKYYAYRLTDPETNVRNFAVDFYSKLSPNRMYWMLINTSDGTTTPTASDFVDFMTDCAIKTEFRVTALNLVKVNGEILNPGNNFCAGQHFDFSVSLRIPVTDGEETKYVEVSDGINFDWFFGTEEEFIENEAGVSLQEALLAFRAHYKDAEQVDENTPIVTDEGVETPFTQAMFDLIKKNCETGPEEGGRHNKLVLCKPFMPINLLSSGLNLVIQPIQTELPEGVEGITDEQWALVCWDHIVLNLVANGEAPRFYPGFDEVAYPGDGTDVEPFHPNIRIGLKQITAMTSDAKTFHIDLRETSLVTEGADYAGLIDDVVDNNSKPYMTYLYLADTDDPYMKDWLTPISDPDDPLGTPEFDQFSLPIGIVTDLQAKPYDKNPTFDSFIEIYFDLNGALAKALHTEANSMYKDFVFKPREGYYYTFTVHFKEVFEGETTVSNACFGSQNLTMKVVPEYMEWTGQTQNGIYANWNNDDNWKRITSDRMKKTNVTDAEKDYFIMDGTNETTNGFVPMYFTKVIMPENSQVELYAAGYSGGSWGYGGVDHRPEDIAKPTENIQYDLMTGKDLKTERYRVSLLNQIHFEPGAEMLHAEYLLYDTAWVDYQLDKGRWYTLASPLKDVVAGDFYTDSDSGKEMQEYFTDITFAGNGLYNNGTLPNNRFSPSVYQRAWKGESTEVPLYTDATNTKNVAISGNWSALYNKVDEAYTPGTGFSLKVQDLPVDSQTALFRLPKADTEYYYYSQDGTEPDEDDKVGNISKDNAHRLKSDELYVRNIDINASGQKKDPIKISLTESATKDYYLVGNPFMAHLDMEKFFEENDSFEEKYWLVTDKNQTAAVGTGEGSWVTLDENSTVKVAPLQSFFVKLKTNEAGNLVAAPENITFTQDMQVLGGDGDGLRSANALTITATTSDGRTSRAAVAYSGMATDDYQSSEDAELFLDSNLGDVPMVYTVAGTMASSINVRQNCELVPLGVYGARNEQVTLRFDQVGVFSGVKLYDTKTKSYTTLTDGSEVSVSTNDYGRYYLTGGVATDNEAIRSVDDISIYSVRSGEIVATSAGSSLRSVRVYGIGGELVTQQSLANQSVYRLRVPGNAIYVVYAEDMDGIIRNVKLRVR